MKVHISIRGRTYTLRTDEDEDLQAIARYVDRKMGEIASRSQRMDDYTVAMLAALNIASELERFRKQVGTELASLDRELASALMLLESASQVVGPEGGDLEEDEDLEAAPETGVAET
jgi:cell division protein ZapA (FtsZ GTPase activity inhibitor)